MKTRTNLVAYVAGTVFILCAVGAAAQPSAAPQNKKPALAKTKAPVKAAPRISPSLEVFGVTIGEGLRQPVCVRPGGKGTFKLAPPAAGVCSARDDAVDPDAKYTGGTALEFARGDLPGWVGESSLFNTTSAQLKDGVVQGFEIPTRGLSVSSDVSAALISKYGKPDEVKTDSFTNGLGQPFEASRLSWNFDNLIVYYVPVGASLTRGTLVIATPDEFVRMAERASKLSESKRPL